MKRTAVRPSQRGAVLLTTVMLLVMVTILALAAVSMNSMQTRVAANSADTLVAYQTAEGALIEAEKKLTTGVYQATSFVNANGLYLFDPALPPKWADYTIWGTPSNVIQAAFQGGSSVAPQYIIEKLPPVTKPGQSMKSVFQVYRITARAVGKSGNSPVVLQSTVQTQ